MILEAALNALIRDGIGGGVAKVEQSEQEATAEVTVIVTHIAGTGFNSKALLRIVYNISKHDAIMVLLKPGTVLTRTTYRALLAELGRLGTVHDLGFKGYERGMTEANPHWPRLSFWSTRD